MQSSWRTPVVVLICGTLVMMLAFGIRQTYGLFLTPISETLGWPRGIFSFAIALQSLIWGLAQPILGGLADRYGSAKVVALSALAYIAGLYLMSVSTDPWSMTFSTAFLTGVAMSGTSFSLVLAVIGRSAPPERRGLYLGIGSAGGSSGQFLVGALRTDPALVLRLGGHAGGAGGGGRTHRAAVRGAGGEQAGRGPARTDPCGRPWARPGTTPATCSSPQGSSSAAFRPCSSPRTCPRCWWTTACPPPWAPPPSRSSDYSTSPAVWAPASWATATARRTC